MSRKRKNKTRSKRLLEMLDKKEGMEGNGKTESMHSEIRYERVFPHKLSEMQEIFAEFYRSINFKEAAQNPEPFIAEIQKSLMSVYNVMRVAWDGTTPIGYIYYSLGTNPIGQAYARAEQIFTRPAYRGRISILRNLFRQALMDGKQCRVEKIELKAATREAASMWRRLGFRDVEVTLRFSEGIDAFIERNKFIKMEAHHGKQIEARERA